MKRLPAAAVGPVVARLDAIRLDLRLLLDRAYDFVRIAAISGAHLRLCGSHAGVSIGEDGAPQMGLEDLAMMRAVWARAVLYPCDGNHTAALVAAMADYKGIAYIRK